ncbi:MAG: hypothetical protein OEX19_06920 [Gammaproteobacteria bacterium]|nr:hypothetical protein [Gammaproteobacteria bacterium]
MDDKLKKLIAEGETYTFANNCSTTQYGTYGKASIEMRSWVADVENFIKSEYGTDSSPWNAFSRFSLDAIDDFERDGFEDQKTIIMSSLKACERIQPNADNKGKDKYIELNNLFKKFHTVAKQLRNRYNGRSTLDIEDEYDVQDLLHALLRIYFEDIRAEEWTPSYAGGSSRMDFLLKEEKIVIEVKKTRKGLNDKELGKQLIEDKEKYKAHPDCRKLICFTYDPEGRIVNPKGLQNDLNKQDRDFEVSIVIEP